MDSKDKILVSAAEAASMLSISRTLFYSQYSAGKFPMKIKIGCRSLWNVAELRDYINAGMPHRSKWKWNAKE